MNIPADAALDPHPVAGIDKPQMPAHSHIQKDSRQGAIVNTNTFADHVTYSTG